MEKVEIIENKKGIYWVGSDTLNENMNCNPYLIIDGDEGILFDPGSVLDFERVYEKVTSLIPLEKIKYVVLHHQDPDFCSSVTLFEEKGSNFKIATHWRTQMLVKYYGIQSEYYIVNENNFQLTLESGRKLLFIPTPYLHFSGAIATYDRESKILFSSDLFGAISNEWSLYAQEDYLENMKAFHEHYMPSNDILRPVMEIFLGMDISTIAPQHGSIINKDVKKYIRALRDLECGTFLAPIHKELSKSGGYMMLCTLVLQRFGAMFGKKEILNIIKNLALSVNEETLEIIDYSYTGDTLWNGIFDNIALMKGIKWLVIVEPYVRKLSKVYEVPMPSIFETITKESYEISSQNQKLVEMNQQLETDIRETRARLLRCPITGLYNFDFFKDYLTTKIAANNGEMESALVIINIDNMAKMRFSYGDNEVNEILKNTVYLIEEVKGQDSSILFRLDGATFAWYFPDGTREEVVEKAERTRNLVSTSKAFVESVTLSIGVVFFDEIKLRNGYEKHPFEVAYELAMLRVRIASTRGKNMVCSSSDVEDYRESQGKILIVDTDEVNMDVLKTVFENLKYQVLTALDGEAALEIAEKELPDAIITETMLPKKDAFMVRESLLMQSATKDIVFIIASHLKNEDSVRRALGLGIEHYLKKPFMLSELVGIIKLKIKGDAYQ